MIWVLYYEYCLVDLMRLKTLSILYKMAKKKKKKKKKKIRKHAYSNIQKFSPPKTENFQIKNIGIFYISARNIDCGYSLEPPRRGGSNEYPQSMFSSKNKKNNVYPSKPQFYCIKVGFKGVKIILACFRDEHTDIYLCDNQFNWRYWLQTRSLNIKW